MFAAKLDMSAAHLSDVGKRTVSAERAARWAEALGYPPAQFVELALQAQLDQSGTELSVSVLAPAAGVATLTVRGRKLRDWARGKKSKGARTTVVILNEPSGLSTSDAPIFAKGGKTITVSASRPKSGKRLDGREGVSGGRVTGSPGKRLIALLDRSPKLPERLIPRTCQAQGYTPRVPSSSWRAPARVARAGRSLLRAPAAGARPSDRAAPCCAGRARGSTTRDVQHPVDGLRGSAGVAGRRAVAAGARGQRNRSKLAGAWARVVRAGKSDGRVGPMMVWRSGRDGPQRPPLNQESAS